MEKLDIYKAYFLNNSKYYLDKIVQFENGKNFHLIFGVDYLDCSGLFIGECICML